VEAPSCPVAAVRSPCTPRSRTRSRGAREAKGGDACACAGEREQHVRVAVASTGGPNGQDEGHGEGGGAQEGAPQVPTRWQGSAPPCCTRSRTHEVGTLRVVEAVAVAVAVAVALAVAVAGARSVTVAVAVAASLPWPPLVWSSWMSAAVPLSASPLGDELTGRPFQTPEQEDARRGRALGFGSSSRPEAAARFEPGWLSVWRK